MKKLYTFLFLLLAASVQLQAQLVQDSVDLGVGYINESYYSLENGEVSSVSATNWHLAFDVSGFGWTIRVNGGQGTKLYMYSNDTSDWSTVDTTGLNFTPLLNSDSSWYIGGFDQAGSGSATDLGWGEYLGGTVAGSRIFILETSLGNYKKLFITRLQSGVYHFRHANLDGTGEVNTTLTKANYPNRLYAYYDVVNDMTHDREPQSGSWDLHFGRWMLQLGPMFRGVTGARHHPGLTSAEYSGVDPETVNYATGDFGTAINIVGYDWKTWNGSAYDLPTDLAYFVTDQNGAIWRLFFTGFNATNGMVNFTKEKMAAVGVEEEFSSRNLTVFPNPTAEQANILLPQNLGANATVTLTSIDGKVVVNQQINTNQGVHRLNVSGLTGGIYFLQLSDGQNAWTNRVVVR